MGGACMGYFVCSSLSPPELQGRFWRKSWDDLNLPDRVKPFFEFVDGYPQVRLHINKDTSH